MQATSRLLLGLPVRLLVGGPQMPKNARPAAASLSPSRGSYRDRRDVRVHRPIAPGRSSLPVPRESFHPSVPTLRNLASHPLRRPKFHDDRDKLTREPVKFREPLAGFPSSRCMSRSTSRSWCWGSPCWSSACSRSIAATAGSDHRVTHSRGQAVRPGAAAACRRRSWRPSSGVSWASLS